MFCNVDFRNLEKFLQRKWKTGKTRERISIFRFLEHLEVQILKIFLAVALMDVPVCPMLYIYIYIYMYIYYILYIIFKCIYIIYMKLYILCYTHWKFQGQKPRLEIIDSWPNLEISGISKKCLKVLFERN